MADFFVSYTGADDSWAQWIGFVLEDAAYSVIIQAWDFRPGSNFVFEMQTAAATADRTIMVLSPDYLKSQFSSSEWSAAFAQDPQGLSRKLLPVKVRECQPPGLLAPLVHIDLVGLDEETAQQRLLTGVGPGRAKPSQRPVFPGAMKSAATAAAFPGGIRSVRPLTVTPHMPNIMRLPTDVERRRFTRQSFDAIREYFRDGLDQLLGQGDGIETDLHENTASDFVAEVFVNGKSKSRSRIRIGGLGQSDGISVSEGASHMGDNAFNEMLSIADIPGKLCLRSVMGGFGPKPQGVDLQQMSSEEAADYLWRRFVSPLER